MRRLLAFSLLLTGLTSAQEKTAIQTSGEEVLVDVVVRDKKGHAVTSLSQSSFTVLDEGVPRQISSFHLVKGTDAVSAAANGTTTTEKLDPVRQIRLVTLIFDRMDQGERAVTRRAALDLLKINFPQNVYMAVFTLGNELQAIQGFTNKRDLLAQAVEKATSRPSSQFSAESDQMRTQAEQTFGPNQIGDKDLVSRFEHAQFASPLDAITARSLIEMISFSERSEMAYAGRSTIWALLAAVRGQTRLPGRKAVIYFSEGFAIPQGAEEEFQAVISAANRNNLSFYPIDAHGLTSASLNAKATEGLSAAAEGSSLGGSVPTTSGLIMPVTQARRFPWISPSTRTA